MPRASGFPETAKPAQVDPEPDSDQRAQLNRKISRILTHRASGNDPVERTTTISRKPATNERNQRRRSVPAGLLAVRQGATATPERRSRATRVSLTTMRGGERWVGEPAEAVATVWATSWTAPPTQVPKSAVGQADHRPQKGQDHDREAAGERDQADRVGRLLLVGADDAVHRRHRRDPADRIAGSDQERDVGRDPSREPSHWVPKNVTVTAAEPPPIPGARSAARSSSATRNPMRTTPIRSSLRAAKLIPGRPQSSRNRLAATAPRPRR